MSTGLPSPITPSITSPKSKELEPVDGYDRLMELIQGLQHRIENQEANFRHQLDANRRQYESRLIQFRELMESSFERHRVRLERLHMDFDIQHQRVVGSQEIALRRSAVFTASLRRTVQVLASESAAHTFRPSVYNGVRGAAAEAFVDEFRLFIEFRGINQSPGTDLIKYFASFLEGPAKVWISPVIRQPAKYQRYYRDVDLMLRDFEAAFAK